MNKEEYKLAEEILDQYLYDFEWPYWSKENAIKAMQEYAKQWHEAKMKEELIKYEVWTHVTPDYGFAEQEVDEYLKQRNK